MDIDMTVRSKNNLPKVARETLQQGHLLLESAMSELVSDIRKSMELSGGGRLYVRHGIPHQASARGKPPAIEPLGFSITAGQLYASISKQPTGPFSGRVYTRTDYARFLEYGTRKMRARPFMRPAARKLRGRWRRLSEGKAIAVIHRKAAV